MIELQHATLSRTGGRAANEDACGYWVSRQGSCFVVSDGAGGHLGGALASEIAVRSMLSAFSAEPKFDHTHVSGVLRSVQHAFDLEKQSHPHLQSMSATIASVFIDPSRTRLTFCQLGDTRIYLFRNGRAHLLSKDHSLAQTLVDSGLSDRTAMRDHPKRSILHAGLGIVSETLATIPAEPFEIRDGDALLVCSDGFWERVLESDMESSLSQVDGPEQWLIHMEQRILSTAQSGFDNYTGVAVWVGAPNETTIIQIRPSAEATSTN